MTQKKQAIKYIVSDVLTALVVWSLFFYFRKRGIGPIPSHDGAIVFSDPNYWAGFVLIPTGWVILYTIMGSTATC